MTAARGSTVRIALLATQAFALGLAIAWIAVSASAIFLEAYGSGPLPVTYVGAAAAGAAATVLLARAVRHRALATVAIRLLGVLAVALVGCWLMLWLFDASWVSFALLVFLPILVPVGFVFLVGQAGALLDVRLVKSLYPRVIAGFASGFAIGGLAAAPLLALLGDTAHLLAAAAIVSLLLLVVVGATRRAFPLELSTVDAGDTVDRPTLRTLLSNRFVALLVLYQMLSAVESQWLDFLVYDRANQRYADTQELATFLGRFLAITYTADIVFLLFIAGFLLRRFGLRYGLNANPGIGVALIVAILAAAALQGAGATGVFVLIVSARITDLVLGDGATRASVGTAYQAVSARERLAAQANVEGLAVPVAIGVSGLGLMIVRATVGTEGSALPLLTGLVLLAWIVVAWFVYRSYRTSLLDGLRHRTLDPTELEIVGDDAAVVVERLLASDDDRDVRLALDTLTRTGSPMLRARVEHLAVHGRRNVRVEALARLSALDPVRAAAIAREGLNDLDSAVRTANVQALGLFGGPEDVRLISHLAGDSADEVREAAAVAMSRIGDESARSEAANLLGELARSAPRSDRALAVRMLANFDPADATARQPLAILLRDDDHDIVNSALAAMRFPADAALLSAAVDRLGDRRTAAAAVDALSRGGSAALTLVADGLSDRLRLGRRDCEHLARVARLIGGRDSFAVLLPHVSHRDRDLGLVVMAALESVIAGQQTAAATDGADRALSEAVVNVVDADLLHATRILRALAVLEDVPSAESLRAALRDELDLQRRRVLGGLALRHGNGVHRVAFQLAQGSARLHSMAMEWLDVTLSGTDRGAMALLEPGRPAAATHRALARSYPLAGITAEELVRDIAEDRAQIWRRPWLSACAVLAASGMAALGVHALTLPAQRVGDGVPADVADIVRETLTALRN